VLSPCGLSYLRVPLPIAALPNICVRQFLDNYLKGLSICGS